MKYLAPTCRKVLLLPLHLYWVLHWTLFSQRLQMMPPASCHSHLLLLKMLIWVLTTTSSITSHYCTQSCTVQIVMVLLSVTEQRIVSS